MNPKTEETIPAWHHKTEFIQSPCGWLALEYSKTNKSWQIIERNLSNPEQSWVIAFFRFNPKEQAYHLESVGDRFLTAAGQPFEFAQVCSAFLDSLAEISNEQL